MIERKSGKYMLTARHDDDAPPRVLSTLAKEFLAAARIMQSSSKELSTLVSGKVQNVNKRTLLLLLLLLRITL